jgi:hypothetical protein
MRLIYNTVRVFGKNAEVKRYSIDLSKSIASVHGLFLDSVLKLESILFEEWDRETPNDCK